MKNIRIGTLVNGPDALRLIPQILPIGFESFNITFWQTPGEANVPDLAKRIREEAEAGGAEISCVSIFSNLRTGEGANNDTLVSWEKLIDNVHLFGANMAVSASSKWLGIEPPALAIRTG